LPQQTQNAPNATEYNDFQFDQMENNVSDDASKTTKRHVSVTKQMSSQIQASYTERNSQLQPIAVVHKEVATGEVDG